MPNDMDALGYLLLLAVDAGYCLASGAAPVPNADAGWERLISQAVASYRARRGIDEPEPPMRVPAWLAAQIANVKGNEDEVAI